MLHRRSIHPRINPWNEAKISYGSTGGRMKGVPFGANKRNGAEIGEIVQSAEDGQ